VDVDLDIGSEWHISAGVLLGFAVLALECPTLGPEVEELREGNVSAVGATYHLRGRGRHTRASAEQTHEDGNLLHPHRLTGGTTQCTNHAKGTQTGETAEAAVKLIKVEYEPLPVVTGGGRV
jgi:hypothetical protein